MSSKITELEKRMINLVNRERKVRGLNSLVISEKLCHIARLHSKVQLQYKSIFHESPVDGSDHAKRIEKGGYMFKACAENVSTAPELVMSHNGLMNSPGHYKNIVGDWVEIGIGIEEAIGGQLYVTQLFANPIKMVDTEILLSQILDGLGQHRKKKNMPPLPHLNSRIVEMMAKVEGNEINDKLFNHAFEDLRKKGIKVNNAQVFQFTGFSNPDSDTHFKLASRSSTKAISIALHQNKRTGVLKGVIVFLS